MADLDVTMRALGSRTRRDILALVWDRELAAGEIAAAFSLTAATISEHLTVLRTAGLVEMTRLGTSRRYRARPEALAGLHGALEGAAKWRSTDDVPERELTRTSTQPVVVAGVELPTPVETTFTALTDPEVYSRWLQVPVTIDGDRFAATLEWGTEVRGRYEIVVPRQLIVMSWDFEDENVPVPGRPLTGYLRIYPDGDGSRVEVHQLVETSEDQRHGRHQRIGTCPTAAAAQRILASQQAVAVRLAHIPTLRRSGRPAGRRGRRSRPRPRTRSGIGSAKAPRGRTACDCVRSRGTAMPTTQGW
jgi:DNA-binding transcriptional ArsR family regulator